jgi:hypothetical protein
VLPHLERAKQLPIREMLAQELAQESLVRASLARREPVR